VALWDRWVLAQTRQEACDRLETAVMRPSGTRENKQTKVALIAMKGNIIDDLEAKIDKNEEGSNNDDLDNSLKEQKKHLESYLDRAKNANGLILASLIHPDPILNCDCYGVPLAKETNNAFLILKSASNYFWRNSSAKLAIRKFLYPKLAEDDQIPGYSMSMSALGLEMMVDLHQKSEEQLCHHARNPNN
jgi:hypothetical protein